MTRILVAALVAAVLLPATAAAELVAFQTPTGNIGCIGGPVGRQAPLVRCDLRSQTNGTPTRPRGCDLEYGDAFAVKNRGRGYRVCHGDTALDPSARTLAYGDSISFRSVTCTSRPAGLTCRNGGGHGFTVSRSTQRVF